MTQMSLILAPAPVEAPAPREPATLEEKFAAFSKANPHVLVELLRLARARLDRGATYISVKALYEELRVSDWARELGLSKETLHQRLKSMPIAAAMTSRLLTRRGDLHVHTKLTDMQVREVRASTENNSVAARRYGVSNQLVSRIRLGQHRQRATP